MGSVRSRKSLPTIQRKVLDFIVEHHKEHGISPRLKEISERVGCSKSSAHAAIKGLVEKKFVVKPDASVASVVPANEASVPLAEVSALQAMLDAAIDMIDTGDGLSRDDIMSVLKWKAAETMKARGS